MKKKSVAGTIILIILLTVIVISVVDYSKTVGGYDKVLEIGKQKLNSVIALVENAIDDVEEESTEETPNVQTAASSTIEKITSKEDDELLKGAVSYDVSSDELNQQWCQTSISGLKVYEYGKTLLNNDEKELYVQLQKALSDVAVKVKVDSKCDYVQFSKVYSYLTQDHSEIFYLSKSSISYYEDKGVYHYVVEFKYYYDGSKEKIQAMNAEIATSATEILQKANAKGSDLEKEKFIHDYIINNCRYDSKAADNINDFSESKGIYGTLINKKAICGGYSSTFQLLVSSLNIKSIKVVGTSDGVAHAWNMVNIDGKWKYVDVTFDDPIAVDQSGKELKANSLEHTYFNYTDDKGHTLYTFNPDSTSSEDCGNYLTMPSVS